MPEKKSINLKREKNAKEKMNSLTVLCDMVKQTNVWMVEVPGRQKREKRVKTMSKNFPSLMKNIIIYIQNLNIIPSRINTKRSAPKLIIIYLLKAKK